eukprot:980275-Pyramimonas_sp.AAC.1
MVTGSKLGGGQRAPEGLCQRADMRKRQRLKRDMLDAAEEHYGCSSSGDAKQQHVHFSFTTAN